MLERDLRDARRADRPAGPAHRARRAGLDDDVAVGAHDRRLRPEPRRPAAHPRRRREPARRSRSATPRSSRTASSAVVRSRRAATDRYTLARRRARRPGSRASPSTASATPRSTGWPGELGPDDVEAVVCHSDMRRTGWFACSDPLRRPAARERRLGHARQLPRHPHRLPPARRAPRLDRRPPGVRPDRALPLRHCRLARLVAGRPRRRARRRRPVPTFVPMCSTACSASTIQSAAAAWGDAAVVVPWALYQRFGDRRAPPRSTRACAPGSSSSRGSRARHVSGTRGFQFGDWLDPTAPPDDPGSGRTDPALVATAYFARSARAPRTWPHCSARARRRRRATRRSADEVAPAFPATYVTPAGWLNDDSETALRARPPLRPAPTAAQRAAGRATGSPSWSAERLPHRHRVRRHPADLRRPVADGADMTAAYRLLLQRECPSWLYPVTMGATTIWERWDSLLPDGTVNPGEMTSFNHYAFGAVADWLHRTVAGLAPAEPGYRRIEIRPRIGAGLDVRTRPPRDTVRSCGSGLEGAPTTVEVEAVIPPNTVATVTSPTLTNVRSKSVRESTAGSSRASPSTRKLSRLRRPETARARSARARRNRRRLGQQSPGAELRSPWARSHLEENMRAAAQAD